MNVCINGQVLMTKAKMAAKRPMISTTVKLLGNILARLKRKAYSIPVPCCMYIRQLTVSMIRIESFSA